MYTILVPPPQICDCELWGEINLEFPNSRIPNFDESDDTSFNNTISDMLENLREANEETFEKLREALAIETRSTIETLEAKVEKSEGKLHELENVKEDLLKSEHLRKCLEDQVSRDISPLLQGAL